MSNKYKPNNSQNKKKIKNKTKNVVLSKFLVVHTYYVRPLMAETRLNATLQSEEKLAGYSGPHFV